MPAGIRIKTQQNAAQNMKFINMKDAFKCHSEEEVVIKECCVAKHAIVSYRVFVLIEVNRSEVIHSFS